MINTVLELDLAGYSNIAVLLEENLNVEAVEAFEDQVQAFVDEGLRAVGLQREDVVLGTAGDNAILLFAEAAQMHRFAETVQHATREHNRDKSVEMAKRWFRMGAATGFVKHIPEERRVVGTTISRAVRLEAAGRKGQLLIDAATYAALPDELKTDYGPEEEVRGKHETERFRARRRVLIPPEEIPEAAAPASSATRTRGRASLAAAAAVMLITPILAFVWRDHLSMLLVRPGSGDAPSWRSDSVGNAAEPNKSKGEPAAPLEGLVNVRFWRPDDPARQNVLVSDPAALPVRAGDQIRIEAQLNRPAYMYLIWITPEGQAAPVYPWSPGDWTRKTASPSPRRSLSLPQTRDRGWPMDGGPGMETLLLLARKTPLPASVQLEELLAGLPAQTMQDAQSLVYLDRGRILVDRTTDRAPQFFGEQTIDDPVLKTQRLIAERLTPYFDVIQAVSFANRGPGE